MTEDAWAFEGADNIFDEITDLLIPLGDAINDEDVEEANACIKSIETKLVSLRSELRDIGA